MSDNGDSEYPGVLCLRPKSLFQAHSRGKDARSVARWREEPQSPRVD